MVGIYLPSFPAVLALSAVLFIRLATAAKGDARCPTGFANFGDSFSDTGNALNAFPFAADPENPPYGRTFFGAPAKRFSDGRLVPDFFSMAFGVPLLDGYFATTSFDYRYGVNFAVGGATATPTPLALTPFALSFQVNQFIRFINNLNGTRPGKGCGNFLRVLPRDDAYRGWLYTIEIGGNDVLSALLNGTAATEIISTVIPAAVQNIAAAVQTLYGKSARKFMIFGVPAQGCSTIILTVLGNLGLPTDSMGCIVSVNQLIQGLNGAVLAAVQGLRSALPDATISYFDYYSANIEILKNPATYGFNPNTTYVACCGAPGVGSLNYNPTITCGHPANGSNVCSNATEYVNWDGVHFTEHFNRAISTFALSGRFVDEGTNATNYIPLCDLDFSKFGSQATYQQVYGSQCKRVFS